MGILIGGVAAAVLIGAVVAVRWGGEEDSLPVLHADDEAVVARGAEIYAGHCASCHGSALEGQLNWRIRKQDGRLPAPPHDPSGHTWHHPDGVLFQLTKAGPAAVVGGGYESDMPAYDGILSDQEIIAVLSFIKSRWPSEIQRRHDEINQRQGSSD